MQLHGASFVVLWRILSHCVAHFCGLPCAAPDHKSAGCPPPAGCPVRLDVVFVLDASGSTEERFYLAQEAAREVVMGLNFDGVGTRVGVLTYRWAGRVGVLTYRWAGRGWAGQGGRPHLQVGWARVGVLTYRWAGRGWAGWSRRPHLQVGWARVGVSPTGGWAGRAWACVARVGGRPRLQVGGGGKGGSGQCEGGHRLQVGGAGEGGRQVDRVGGWVSSRPVGRGRTGWV